MELEKFIVLPPVPRFNVRVPAREGIMNNSNWIEATCKKPCPICGHDSWCTVSRDGRVVNCRRVDTGGRPKTDRTGAEYWVHHLDEDDRIGAVSIPGPSSIVRSVERADDATLSAVYNALLSELRLLPQHASELKKRGLSADEIVWRQYRSLPPNGTPWTRHDVARRLADRFGDETLAKVPGFIRRCDSRGCEYWTITGLPGLLIPVRNVKAEIVALKLRPDDPGDGGKYRALSSRSAGGPGPGSPAHVPLSPFQTSREDGATVAIVEGVLKADVVAALDPSGIPCIGIDGCGAWRAAVPVLAELNARRVNYYIDPDALKEDHPQVGAGLKAFWSAMKRQGYALGIALDAGRSR